MLKKMISIGAVAGLVLALMAGAAQAALIAQETFEPEALGAFDGTADQTWTLGTSDEQIVNRDLSYSGGAVTIDDGDRNLRLSNLASILAPVADFTFTPESGPIYFSFLAEATSGLFFQPFVSGSPDHRSSASVGMDTRTGDTVTARLTSSTGPLAAGTGDLENAIGGLTFVVGKLFKSGGGNYDRLQMEFNPTTTSEPAVWDADLTGDIGVTSVNRFGMRFGAAAGAEYAYIDEIRVGTGYSDVFGIPVSPKIVAVGDGQHRQGLDELFRRLGHRRRWATRQRWVDFLWWPIQRKQRRDRWRRPGLRARELRAELAKLYLDTRGGC